MGGVWGDRLKVEGECLPRFVSWRYQTSPDPLHATGGIKHRKYTILNELQLWIIKILNVYEKENTTSI